MQVSPLCPSYFSLFFLISTVAFFRKEAALGLLGKDYTSIWLYADTFPSICGQYYRSLWIKQPNYPAYCTNTRLFYPDIHALLNTNINPNHNIPLAYLPFQLYHVYSSYKGSRFLLFCTVLILLLIQLILFLLSLTGSVTKFDFAPRSPP